MISENVNRRKAIKRMTSAGLALATLSPLKALLAESADRRFKIGACDWSIGKKQDITAIKLAQQIGLDGVQVSFGEPGGEYDLRQASVRQAYATACETNNVEIASLAMGVLNQIPYSSDARAEEWVSECVDVMVAMQQKVVLLAFFGKGDIKNKPDLQKEVIRRLKRIAPKAEKAGIVLGLETWLNADEHIHILDSVDSPAVQVYYDVANSNKMGYDIYQEIRQLGKDRICEIHCKENGFLLGNGRVDFKKLKVAVDDIDYQGWLVIEGAVRKGMTVLDSYQHNQKYLRSVFEV